MPPPLSDDEISAVLDGTAGDDVMRHVALCADCARRVALARHLESVLAQRLNRWDCPPPLALGEYHLNLLSEHEARAIRKHIEGCPRCQAELRELSVFLENGLREDSKAVEPAAKRPRRPMRLGLPQILSGTVLTNHPALALRGTGEEPVIIETDGLTLYLKLEPRAGQPVLLGQIAGDSFESWVGALVQFWQEDALRATAEVDDLGTFRCEAIALQPFELIITAPHGATILVPEIYLTE